ncbi:DUF4288 domain-containing protein [Rhodopirellula bahusiensis]|uniref:DUF4288 domain-containing protein n=1 Tax=Rhodopirellula bahusiensis TaxID=2014065 RepID=UPI003264CC48
MNRYAAKLLFQFRVDIDGDAGKRRTCEERIVVFIARNATSALAKSKRKGRDSEHNYLNSDGNPVFFEFVGVMDLLKLGLECDPDEVWYDIRERLMPMERRDVFIPAESELNAMRTET